MRKALFLLIFILMLNIRSAYANIGDIYQAGTESSFVSGLTNITIGSGIVYTGDGVIWTNDTNDGDMAYLITANAYNNYSLTVTIYNFTNPVGTTEFSILSNNIKPTAHIEHDSQIKNFIGLGSGASIIYYLDSTGTKYYCNYGIWQTNVVGLYFRTPFNLSIVRNETAYSITIYNSTGIMIDCSIDISFVNQTTNDDWISWGERSPQYWNGRLGIQYFNLTNTSFTSVPNTNPEYISNCRELNETGKTYILTNDILNASVVCLSISADSVTLDCNNHIINGPTGVMVYPHSGILATNVRDIIIKNCYVKNYFESNYDGSGFTIQNTNDSILINNTADSNARGFELFYGYNNYFINNTVINSKATGFKLQGYNNYFINNTIINCSWSGYNMSWSSNNTIINNTINSNGFGIYLYGSSNNITGNIINLNNYGISLFSSSNNILSNNTVYQNNYGISLHYASDNNNITSNIVMSNSVGFSSANYHSDSLNNSIYNNFFQNTVNAYDDGRFYNYWNTTKTLGTNIIGGPYIGGNYWSDYKGIDTSGDGLGNTNLPYNSNGNITVGGDYLPLTAVNIEPPNITILYPQTNTSYSKINVILLFTVDRNTSWIGYSLNNRSNTTVTSLPIFLTNYSGLYNGWNSLAIYANDTYGVMGSSTERFFYCLGDITGPTSWVPDGKVDMRDIGLVASKFGCNAGSACYDTRVDINDDGKIDMKDIGTVASKFGAICK